MASTKKVRMTIFEFDFGIGFDAFFVFEEFWRVFYLFVKPLVDGPSSPWPHLDISGEGYKGLRIIQLLFDYMNCMDYIMYTRACKAIKRISRVIRGC